MPSRESKSKHQIQPCDLEGEGSEGSRKCYPVHGGVFVCRRACCTAGVGHLPDLDRGVFITRTRSGFPEYQFKEACWVSSIRITWQAFKYLDSWAPQTNEFDSIGIGWHPSPPLFLICFLSKFLVCIQIWDVTRVDQSLCASVL